MRRSGHQHDPRALANSDGAAIPAVSPPSAQRGVAAASHRRGGVISVARTCALVALLSVAAAPTLAASGRQSATRPAPSPPTWTALDGTLSLRWPSRGVVAETRQWPSAASHQMRAQLDLARGGDVVVRADAFANPARASAAAWLDGDQRPLGLAADDARPLTLPAPLSGVVLQQHASAQSPARTIALVAGPTFRLRLTCERAGDAGARSLWQAVLSQVAWRPPSPPPPAATPSSPRRR